MNFPFSRPFRVAESRLDKVAACDIMYFGEEISTFTSCGMAKAVVRDMLQHGVSTVSMCLELAGPSYAELLGTPSHYPILCILIDVSKSLA